ncbi:MAG: hypothetical protein AAF772_05700 [Acidobacteriota bacterium]
MTHSIRSVAPKVVRSAWEEIFNSNDPFVWPFRSQFLEGRLAYPTDGYHLTKEQFLAVSAASKELGEEGFYLSVTESEGLSFLDRPWGHWLSNTSTYEKYAELSLPLENAMYSRQGRWGAIVSHEMHALIAGPPRFLSALDARYPSWEMDMNALRSDWPSGVDMDWLAQMTSMLRTG